ncbi:MAG: hypothetical protein IKU19_05730 [Clostridia bacterium]|nr:hypothetical protein [Clostridia bacterium]
MDRISVDFSRDAGRVKPMHSVNNGPVYKFSADQRITNIDHFRNAGIPYARTHDASFFSTYGGEHTVDVNMIFTDWSKDATDPASYDFVLTDEYMRVIEAGGSKVFYRLGTKIEHWKKKYNTLPPKDNYKWAVVCEHIIRHYTEGWADGFNMDIEYWEIWNEPDLDSDDAENKRCWGGTAKEFYQLFCVAFKHLKSCFPHLKIGGPACAKLKEAWLTGFFDTLKANDIVPDFFSWHVYGSTIEKVREKIRYARDFLDKYGFESTESILNEWNYVKKWVGDEWIYSLEAEKGLKGASFIAATMCMSQYEKLDNLMFYDARPGAMNSLFNTDMVYKTLKGYYPFYMFNQLYKLDNAVEVERYSEDVWAAAAKGEEQNVMLCYFQDDDTAPEKTVKVEFKNVENKNGVKLEYYCLDEDHDCELIREEIFTATEFAAYIKMPRCSTYLLKIVNM